jgi:hypothetical protein
MNVMSQCLALSCCSGAVSALNICPEITSGSCGFRDIRQSLQINVSTILSNKLNQLPCKPFTIHNLHLHTIRRNIPQSVHLVEHRQTVTKSPVAQ